MEFASWCKACQCRIRGSIWIKNTTTDLDCGRFPAEIWYMFCEEAQKLCEEAQKHCTALGITEPLTPGSVDPRRYYQAIVSKNPTQYLCKGAEFRCSDQLSRVVEASTFLFYNVTSDVKNDIGWRENVDQSEERSVPELLKVIASGVSGWAKGEMKGHYPLAWVSKSSALDEIRNSSENAATGIRNKLGLLDYTQDQYLIEIVYPSSVITCTRLFAPTSLDAGPNLVFRSLPDHYDEWGRAVDLESLDDGLPEAVHAPVPLTDEFRLKPLGRIVGNPAFDHRKFRQRMESNPPISDQIACGCVSLSCRISPPVAEPVV